MRTILDAALESVRGSLTELDIGGTGAGAASAGALTTLVKEARTLLRLGPCLRSPAPSPALPRALLPRPGALPLD